jgi:serine/threonine protein kinase
LLIVEYLSGGTLADRLRRGPISFDATLHLGIAMTDVLDRMHRSGVLHRDVKPSNIGYTSEGVPKLLDFGVSSMIEEPASVSDIARRPALARVDLATAIDDGAKSLTGADHVVGTPLYLSAEALMGREPNPTFDLWSLSVVLFEAYSGHNPFWAATVDEVYEKIQSISVPAISTFRADCAPPLVRFFQDVLSRDRVRLPSDAADLRNRLHQLRVDMSAVRD